MFAAVAFLMTAPVLVGQSPPAKIEGVALFAGTDRPAAGLTLQIINQADPSHAAKVDPDGRFRAPAPAGWTVPQPDGTEAPCWAVAEPEGRWRIEPINRPPFHSSPAMLRESVARGLSHQVKGAWRDGVLRVECPEPGEVDVLVRGVDGGPLVDRPIEVVPDAEALQAGGPVNARFSGRTDAAGRFLMRWFEGVRRLRITAPGEGVCSTPVFQIAPGRTTSVDAMPMARIGSIAGRLAPNLVAPDLRIVLDPEVLPPAPCDREGRFAIPDVPPGRYLLRASNGRQAVRAAQVTVWLAPGERVEGVVIDETPPPSPEETEQQRKALERMNGRTGPNARDELWIEGAVRDLSGRPVVGADVFIRTAFHGGIRMYEDVRQTKTDDQGRYAVSGPVHSYAEGLVVLVKAPGRPPALARAGARSTQRDQPSKLDLTLADSGGSAVVRVVDARGKPLAGIGVRLEAEGGANVRFGFGWAAAASNPANAALDAIATPGATTGRDGVARFTELLPGLYTIRLSAMDRSIYLNDGVGPTLAVSPDREATTTVAAAPKRRESRFLIVWPDGRPAAGRDVGFRYGLGGRTYLNSSLKLDENGIGERLFDSDGLWTVFVRFRDTPDNPFGIDETPYYEAEAQVPVSPALDAAEPIRMVGVLHERRGASLRVRLLDADGRPARGAVDFGGAIAATDDRGEVLFEDLSEPRPGNRQFVSAYLEAPSPTPWSSAGPGPTDEDVAKPAVLVPAAEVKVVAGREETIELQAQPLGYVRGKLRPGEGRKAADYAIYPSFSSFDSRVCWRYNLPTGDFVGGPFSAGPATFLFSTKTADGAYVNCGKQVVQVVPGKAVQVDFKPGKPEPVDPQSGRAQVSLGMGGLSINPGAPDAAPLKVLLPDGKTPAYGAQAYLYEPDQEQAAAHGICDAGGRPTWRGLWRSAPSDDHPVEGLVEKPTLVVSLPGRFGAAIVPFEKGKAQDVVLPAAIDAEGTVKVGGRGPGGDGSLVRIVAAHQGRGVLDGSLGVAATAALDGRFRLYGLTPGRYRVQACRDGVWTSKPVDVQVEEGRSPPPLALEIPAPGAPTTLEFVDRAGRPLAGESFKLARPDGPFDSIRPAVLRSDASGRLTLRGLEAGMHTISSSVSNESAGFEVPEARGGAVQPTVLRIVLLRPEP